MSRGPGQIEQRIGDLFAATRDRALSVSEIAGHAFALDGKPASRAQRLSATRAAHRVLRRVREVDAKAKGFNKQAHDNTTTVVGPETSENYDEYQTRLKADPAWLEYEKLDAFCQRVGVWLRIVPVEGKPGWLRGERDYWSTTALDNGRLYFHPPDVPVRVWAVSIQPTGVIWAEAEVTRVTERNVIALYDGKPARLNREGLWYWWAWWRGVMFVSSRTGRIAAGLDEIWQDRYGRHAAGGAPPVMQMPLARAMELLGVPANYTHDDVIAGFRRAAKKAHPDMGGSAELFRLLVEARDRLLAALGTSAPAPRMPKFAPVGTQFRTTKMRMRGPARLGHTRRLSA